MGKKKVGKERLDKFYHFAKEQGYRSRAAFKLIQLAKKYDFLSSARSCIDLCGAPGSWSQVAVKNMPLGSKVICIDLAPIKAIKGVTTFQCDITTARCRNLLKKELINQKCDVVLNDGAPNVGAAWTKDAFGQAELTLMATKLACEFLVPGGTFVTKIFRSSDYNSLLWVLQQLFKKVEATKPQASRNVSAEIFVVCLGYKAPEKLDDRFFDSKYVFMETTQEVNEENMSLHDHMKRAAKKNRSGYSANDDYRVASVLEFFDCEAGAAKMLVDCHKISFPSPESDHIINHPSTTEEIRTLCDDLKVCNKGDLTVLMKWRAKIQREKLQQQQAKDRAIAKAERQAQNDAEDDEDDKEANDDAELKLIIDNQLKVERNQRKKLAELRKKQEFRKKQSMGVFDPSRQDPDLFYSRGKRSAELLEQEDELLGADVFKSDQSDVEMEDENEDDEKEEIDNVLQMEIDEAIQYQMDQARKSRTQLARAESRKKETRRQRVTKEWSNEMSAFSNLIEQRVEDEHQKVHDISEDEDDSEEEDATKEEIKTDRWFSQDIFKDMFAEPEGLKIEKAAESDDDAGMKELDEADVLKLPLNDKQKRRARKLKTMAKEKAKAEAAGESDGELEVVPEMAPEDIEANKFKPDNNEDLAETLAIGSLMIHKKSRMDLIDSGYNRYSHNDPDGLPEWFTQEEEMFMKPELPISKELMSEYRAKLREINARPIRKVAEAQARKKTRISKRMEKIRKTAQGLAEQEDMGTHSKIHQVKKMLSAAKRKEKSVTILSATKAGGGQAKQTGKVPAGAKVKQVDRRLKKDKRSEKRSLKKKGLKPGQSKKGRAKNAPKGKKKGVKSKK